MKLIKYRDSGTGNQYTYFWVSDDDRTISPYFDSEKEAQDWVDSFDNWKPNKDIS